jgi:hypothetical protein
MGQIAPRGYEKKPQSYWDSQIKQNQKVIEIERDPVPARPILFSEEEYDTLQPEENIKNFCFFIRQALSKYEANKIRLSELESRLQDLLHFVEMSKDKDAVSGYRIYKDICNTRRERRQCKNEIELLTPVYELFHGTKVLDQLASVQGSCKQIKKTISNKGYSIRTDVLDDFLKQ